MDNQEGLGSVPSVTECRPYCWVHLYRVSVVHDSKESLQSTVSKTELNEDLFLFLVQRTFPKRDLENLHKRIATVLSHKRVERRSRPGIVRTHDYETNVKVPEPSCSLQNKGGHLKCFDSSRWFSCFRVNRVGLSSLKKDVGNVLSKRITLLSHPLQILLFLGSWKGYVLFVVPSRCPSKIVLFYWSFTSFTEIFCKVPF